MNKNDDKQLNNIGGEELSQDLSPSEQNFQADAKQDSQLEDATKNDAKQDSKLDDATATENDSKLDKAQKKSKKGSKKKKDSDDIDIDHIKAKYGIADSADDVASSSALGYMPVSNVIKVAQKASRAATIAKLVTGGLFVLVAVVAVVYTIAYFYNFTGSFTIAVNDDDRRDLALVWDRDSTEYERTILVDPLKKATNISGATIPSDVDQIFGDHSTKNYIAVSFYVKNIGPTNYDLYSSIKILKATKNVDAAIRIKVYVEGEPGIYAKPNVVLDEETGKTEVVAEPGTTAFRSSDTVYEQVFANFAPNETKKFTVLLWLEGPDPQCTDSIIGGEINMNMSFTASNN